MSSLFLPSLAFATSTCWGTRNKIYISSRLGSLLLGWVWWWCISLYCIHYISYISYIYIFISCIKICHIVISQIYIMLLRVNLSVAVVAMTTNKTHRLPNGTTTEVRRQKRHKSWQNLKHKTFPMKQQLQKVKENLLDSKRNYYL